MYKPLTKEFLLKRGYCCKSGCKNCPYNYKRKQNTKKYLTMKEIDQMLKQWIPVNTIIRKQLRDLIVKEIEKERVNERLKILKWDAQLKNKL